VSVVKFGLRIFNALGWNLFGKSAVFFINFLISILLARSLHPDGYGLYASLMSIAAALPMIMSLGFGQVLNVYIPKFNSEGNIAKISFLLKKMLLIRGILSLILSLLLYLFSLRFSNKMGPRVELIYYLKYIAIYIFLENFIGIFISLNVGLLNLKKNALISIFSRTICLILLIFFLSGGFGLKGVFYSLIISTIFSLIIYLKSTMKYIKSVTAIFQMNELYKLGLVSWLIVFINFILGKNTDILLLNIFKIPNAEIGFYNLSISMTIFVAFLIAGTGPIFQSVFAESFARGGVEKLTFVWLVFIKLVTVLMFPVFIFFFIYAKDIISILYTSEYLPVVALFRVYSLLLIIYTLIGSSQCLPIFYVLQKKKMALYLIALGGIINLILDLILIPVFGSLGAIFATGTSLLIIGIIGLLQVRKFLKFTFPNLFYFKIASASILAILPTLVIQNRTPWFLSLNVFLFVTTLIILLYFFKPLEAIERVKIKLLDNRLFRILAKF
jgi:O-antigen/teichoic acid export membrane protein